MTSLPPYWITNKDGTTKLANPKGLFSDGFSDNPNQPRWSASPKAPRGDPHGFLGGPDPTEKLLFDPVRQKHLQEEVLHQQRQLSMVCELVTRLSADCEHLQRCVIQLDERLADSNKQIAELKSCRLVVEKEAAVVETQKKQKRDE
jgi:hypothetical protein